MSQSGGTVALLRSTWVWYRLTRAGDMIARIEVSHRFDSKSTTVYLSRDCLLRLRQLIDDLLEE